MRSYEECLIAHCDAAHGLDIETVVEVCQSRHSPAALSRVWRDLDHGQAILQNELELDSYMVSYGLCHARKLRYLFPLLPLQLLRGTFEICDWGCGQGLASLVFIEELRRHGLEENLRKVNLIDAGEPAIERAIVNLENAVVDGVKVNALVTPLDAAGIAWLNHGHNEAETPLCVHLLCNIVDLATVDYQRLIRLIKSRDQRHLVICTGPLNGGEKRVTLLPVHMGARKRYASYREVVLGRFASGRTYGGAGVMFDLAA